jgi:hypothetical protein
MADVPAATPQEKSTATPRKPKRAASKTREVTTSAVLITFTALVGIACVIALASTLTQTRVSTISIDGVPLSVWKLDDIRLQWSVVRAGIRDLSDNIAKSEQDRNKFVGAQAAIEEVFQAKDIALSIRVEELMFRLRVINPDLAKTIDDKKRNAEKYGLLDVARESLLKDHAIVKEYFERLDTAYEEYGKARADRANAAAKSDAIVKSIAGLQNAVAGSQTSLETLYRQVSTKFKKAAGNTKDDAKEKEVDLDDATRARIENALYELHSGFLGWFINLLVTTQPDILTLILVILMGILGSSLQMTYAFFKRHQIEAVGAYMLRVCVGAITALVIFIVAKAGVPVIADASKLGGDAGINPYFVSFLAIISGLMSENAIASVQNQGARFFGAENTGEPPRWARQDLRPAFTTANRDPERVKRLLQAKDEDFEGWMSGKDPLPANAQMIIAGVLQTPARDLFTDIPPDQAGTTS